MYVRIGIPFPSSKGKPLIKRLIEQAQTVAARASGSLIKRLIEINVHIKLNLNINRFI
ncbi:hypothetical protein [Bacillus sp. JJ1773]|uniref:hypothetical protein n=1 Tax=Bacillus sp. JJ1773 TaxID=3122965 RepID=UPI002FFD59FA